MLFVGRGGADELALRLRTSVPLQIEDGAAVAEFTLRAGRVGVASSSRMAIDGRACAQSNGRDYVTEAFKETVELLAALDRPRDLQRPLARDR